MCALQVAYVSLFVLVFKKRPERRYMCVCSQDCYSLGLSKLPLESSSGCAVFLFEKGEAFSNLQESTAKASSGPIKTL